MFMKKIIFLFATVILLTSCVFDRVFRFRFYNHSSCDVGLILDLNPYDGIITEQILINNYGLENLYNIRNSISPKYWNKYGIKP